ncbi:uncharacterized protein LOC109847545 [Asparagus officinalis]|uniref:uncharacterized protein LOC109847545 n=1 Tax=Asparagus officinalis TaxID=4686 RepID=UPI00098E2D31|nr:uncharacterized protein LOC109847545 [Asparagus officinalis]
MKGVQQFVRWEKIAQRYVGPIRIIKHVIAISYGLDLPTSLSSVYDVFHVSMLKKHLRDEEQQRVIDALKIEIKDDLTTIEILVCILAREAKKIRNKVIPLV